MLSYQSHNLEIHFFGTILEEIPLYIVPQIVCQGLIKA